MNERQDLLGRRIVLGLTGGVACYKSAELLRLLVKQGAQVRVVLTDAAQQFITVATMQALSGEQVATSQWDDRDHNHMPHINLSRWAEAVIVAPASADFMAQLLHGHANELLPLLCLARPRETCALLVAPAMNKEMWSHPATQRNVQQLTLDGTHFLGPSAGEQACGDVGDGRMREPSELLEDIIAFFQPKVLSGKRLLITAGPTFEPIDPVRGITNHSSGKMGFALARAAREAGAWVTLVAGPVHLPTPLGIERINVMTAQQMLDTVIPLASQHDIFIATAAVADWRPSTLNPHKIKKQGKKSPPIFELTENPDILATVAALSSPPFCVGFAAESEDLLRHTQNKLMSKKVPLMVGNLGPSTFGSDHNSLLLVDEKQHYCLPKNGGSADKLVLARALIQEVACRLQTPN